MSFDKCILLCNPNPIKIQNITIHPIKFPPVPFQSIASAHPPSDNKSDIYMYVPLFLIITVLVIFKHRFVLPVLEPHMNGNRQYVFCENWAAFSNPVLKS